MGQGWCTAKGAGPSKVRPRVGGAPGHSRLPRRYMHLHTRQLACHWQEKGLLPFCQALHPQPTLPPATAHTLTHTHNPAVQITSISIEPDVTVEVTIADV